MYFSEEHKMLREMARNFAVKELTPEVLNLVEETGVFPMEIRKKMGEMGFYGIKIPVEFGGQGLDTLSYVVIMEEIARASAVATLYVSSPNALGGGPLLLAGTNDQKKKYLTPIATGEQKACFALTEPGAGSDAGSILTSAVKDGEHYILNGRKCFITSAPISDFFIVYAKTDKQKGIRGISAFIVNSKLPGVSTGKPERKMGLIGCPTSDILLEDVRVHESDRLGNEGEGWINAMKTLDMGRIGVGCTAIGIAQAALDEAIKYAGERKQFGRLIADFQAVSFMIAEMATKLESAKLLVYQAAWLKDNGQDAGQAASMAKFYSSEICNEICAKAVQIHGGYGYIKEYKVERLYRDSRVLTIFEGTSQIQQSIIANYLLKKIKPPA